MRATCSLGLAQQGIESGSYRGALALIASFSTVYQPLLVIRSAGFEPLLPILALEVDFLAKCHLSWQGTPTAAHKERNQNGYFRGGEWYVRGMNPQVGLTRGGSMMVQHAAAWKPSNPVAMLGTC